MTTAFQEEKTTRLKPYFPTQEMYKQYITSFDVPRSLARNASLSPKLQEILLRRKYVDVLSSLSKHPESKSRMMDDTFYLQRMNSSKRLSPKIPPTFSQTSIQMQMSKKTSKHKLTFGLSSTKPSRAEIQEEARIGVRRALT
mmetsp:Transcript_16480/g.25441  ORF Transcript_16480/g.25441 Transcript_16480/m.25441 type:complete len:142 (-) Transcript_16480:666-1091(-)|eukprot:CAMPEP_0170488354 /NCGR_PEP_ID=MMETSP0208-20121228/6931_1 /TAXON_ID=197538 /ORGANISM="Strombidium inclinatum, Strain S3" /LENGTH=141 /DNA_ID=CAMNT_0010762899 /DNA_START=237 /DNA_END=662 /DNA_ORIENTATION=+